MDDKYLTVGMLKDKYIGHMKSEFYTQYGKYLSQGNKEQLWTFLYENYRDKLKKPTKK
jgi:hypothetical protein